MYRDRRIPPNEAQRILARALELQRAEGGGRDMSDEEIARTLGELGVEDRLVRQAMDDDGADPAEVTSGPSWLTGTPLRLAFERHVGRVVAPTDHTRIVDAIRRAAGEHGQTEIVGDEIAWTSRMGRGRGRGSFRVTVAPSADGTKIRVEEDLRAVAGGLFGGVLGGVGTNALVWAVLTPAVFHGPILVSLLLVGFVIAVYAVLRASFGAFVRRRRTRVARIAEKVAAETAAHAPANVRVDPTARARVVEGGADEVDAADEVDSERARAEASR